LNAATGRWNPLSVNSPTGLYVDGALDLRVETLLDQDLAGDRLVSEARREIRHRPDRRVVGAALEADLATGRVAEGDTDAEVQGGRRRLHPSAHSCASSAIVHTMQEFFGTDKISFDAFSTRTRTTRSFDRLSDALKEVIDARVWGGIHFRTADVQGAVLGKKVAHYLQKDYFQPTD
jgi:hypothetical protein